MSANLLQTINTGLGRRTSQSPEREDFSKIATAVRIPNLIEVQRESYNRFLQMDLIPEERETSGCSLSFSRSFRSRIFARRRRSNTSSTRSATGSANADNLEGLEHLRANCKNCGAKIKVDPFNPAESSLSTTAARSTPFARSSATTAASRSASSTSTTSRNARNAACRTAFRSRSRSA